jgi:hypothetical protein
VCPKVRRRCVNPARPTPCLFGSTCSPCSKRTALPDATPSAHAYEYRPAPRPLADHAARASTHHLTYGENPEMAGIYTNANLKFCHRPVDRVPRESKSPRVRRKERHVLGVPLEGTHTCPILLCANGAATLLHGARLLSLRSLKPKAASPQEKFSIPVPCFGRASGPAHSPASVREPLLFIGSRQPPRHVAWPARTPWPYDPARQLGTRSEAIRIPQQRPGSRLHPGGTGGVAAVRRHSPDIVILDFGIPDINGLDVIGRIRHFSNVYILMLTGNEDLS